MNSNTKILKELLSIKSNIDDMHIITSDGYFALESLILMVQENIREETAKSSGKTNAYKVVTKLLNKFREECGTTHRVINSYPYETDTAQYVINAYSGFKFTEFLPLEKCPDKLIEHYGCQPLNLEKIFTNNTVDRTKEISKKPTLAELKSYIKLKKAENKVNKGKYKGIIFDFGDGLPAVNAEYLLNIYEVLGADCNIYCKEYKSESSSLWIKSSDRKTEAVLMPVSKESY